VRIDRVGENKRVTRSRPSEGPRQPGSRPLRSDKNELCELEWEDVNRYLGMTRYQIVPMRYRYRRPRRVYFFGGGRAPRRSERNQLLREFPGRGPRMCAS
jgi:hypothetical protein